MGYDVNNNTRSESRTYKGTINVKDVSRDIGAFLSDKNLRDERNAKKKAEALLRQDERGYTSQLTDLGKLSYFIEYFDMISLKEQTFESVGPFNDPSLKASFKYGYEMGKILVNNGFSEENYRVFIENYERKYLKNNPKLK